MNMTAEPKQPPDLRAVLRQAHIALCVVIAQENTGHDPSTYQVVGDAAKAVEAALKSLTPPNVHHRWPAQGRCESDAEAFNQRHSTGVAVRYWPVAEQSVAIDTVTRSAAWTVCGEPVVKIIGRTEGVALSHLAVLGPTSTSIPGYDDPDQSSRHTLANLLQRAVGHVEVVLDDTELPPEVEAALANWLKDVRALTDEAGVQPEHAVDWGRCALEAAEFGRSIDVLNNLSNFRALVELASRASTPPEKQAIANPDASSLDSADDMERCAP